MKKNKIKKIIILGAILLLPSFFYLFLTVGKHNILSLPYYGPREVITVTNSGVEKEDTIYFTVPDFSFINQHGTAFKREHIEGKIVVANFFFVTCPTICPKMATHIYDVQKTFEGNDNILFVSHTVNPESDSVPILAAYAKKVHAGNNWHFLTGRKEDIYNVAMKGYFVSAMPDEIAPGGFLHSEMLILLDKKGHIRGYFDGTSTSETKKLKDAIRILLANEFVPKKKK
jgi:protein SCO1/2